MFHYATNAEGFYGIFNNRCLWATEFRGLSDTSEYVYGQRLIHDVLAERTDTLSKSLYARSADSMRSLSAVTLYIASGCQQGDLLSQWRGYAKVGDGYSIALSTAALRMKRPWKLPKVLCSTEQQTQIIHRILEAWNSVEDDTGATYEKEVFMRGLVTLVTVIASFKDSSFSGEEEWRLPPEETIRFRVLAGG